MFPKDFLFGSSLSGFQFEMGAGDDVDDRSDWYLWARYPGNVITGRVSGDLPERGTGYWKNFKRIHDLAEASGMRCLRIGIEWSRIFPQPTTEVEVPVRREDGAVISVEVGEGALRELERLANGRAVERYREILADLRRRGFTVMANLNHFTLPLWLHDPIAVHRGEKTEAMGWASSRTVVEFAKYAAYVARALGDLVHLWSTMNEPMVVSQMGYLIANGEFPPSYFSPELFLRTLVNQAQAHARAYELLKGLTGNPVGIIYSFACVEPEGEGDGPAKEKADRFANWQFMDMVTRGVISGTERPDMKGKMDFIGINYYSRLVVSSLPDPVPLGEISLEWQVLPGYGFACREGEPSRAGRPTSDRGWEVYPEGLYKVIREVHARYPELELWVTENGIADERDSLRPYFLISHLYAVERAVGEGIPLKGYLHWSLVDNFEWAHGYRKRFGLVHVEFPAKAYIPRPSYFLFRELISRGSVEDFRPFLRHPYDLWQEEFARG